MADSKPIKSTDVIQKGLFNDTIEGAKSLEKELGNIDEGLQKIIKDQDKILKQGKKGFGTAEEVDKITKAIEKNKKAREGLTTVQKQRLKLQKQLKEANSDSIQANEELKVQLTKQKKANKDLAKEKLGLISTYDKESKRLNDLRKKYKNLVLEQGRSAKGTKELRDEIQDLDKALKDVDADAGQFQRSVGDYPKSTGKAKAGFASLSGFLLGAVVGAFTKSRKEARTFNITLEKIKNSVGIVGIAIAQFFTNMAVPAVAKFGLTISNVFKSISIQFKELQATAIRVDEFFGLEGAAKKAKELQKEIKTLKGDVVDNEKSIKEYSETLKNAKNPFTGLIDRISLSNDTLGEQLELEDRLIDATARLTNQIQKLTIEEELLQQIADDTTKSFKDREEAINGVIDVQKKRFDLEVTLAKKEFEVARLAVKNDFIRKNRLAEFKKLEEAGQLKNLEFLKSKEAADTIGIETLGKLTSATGELIRAEGDLELATKDAEKTRNELKQDRLEKDLDILLDGFDNQKTINERLIANEKDTFDKRQALLDETIKLGDDSFDKQIETIQKFTDKQIDANDLVAESDAVVLNKKIRALGLSEIIEGRLLEVIRDRKSANQDLKDSEIDLNDARLESLKNIQASEQATEQDDLALKAELLERELDQENLKLEKITELTEDIFDVKKLAIEDQAEFEKKQAEQDIFDAEELAAKLLEIENKKDNDIIRLEKEKLDAIAEANRLAAAERVDFLKDIASQTLSELKLELDRINQEKRNALDKEIEDRAESVEKQERLAEKGLENQLAFENKKAAEAELAKREQLEREQKQKEAIQLAEAFLEAYIAELNKPGADPLAAGAKALTATLVAKGIGKTIASFYDGTEATGKAGNALDSNGGRLAVLHDNERVMTKDQNSMTGGMSNNDLAQLAYDYNTGNLLSNSAMAGSQSTNIIINNDQVIVAITSLEKAIKDKPVSQFELDKYGSLIERAYKNGIKETTRFKNSKGRKIFG